MADHKAQARQFTDALQANPEWQKYWAEQMATMQRGLAAGTKIDQNSIRAYYQPQWAAEAKRITGMDVPHDYEFNMVGSLNGRPDELMSRRGFIDRNPWFMPAAAAGAGIAAPIVGFAAGGGAAAGAGAGAGSAGIPALSSLPVTAANPTAGILGTAGSIAGPGASAAGAAGAAGTGAKVAGGVGKFLNSPLGMGLLGTGLDIFGSLFGGDDDRSTGRDDLIRSLMATDPNSEQGKLINPKNALFNALQAVIASGKDIGSRPMIQPRPISAAPAPRSLPGVPFQIGGSVPQGPISRTYQGPADINKNTLALLEKLMPSASAPTGAPPQPTQRRSVFNRPGGR